MKKSIFLTMAMASLVFTANALTNMCVKSKDGKVVEYNVENVVCLDYEVISENPSPEVDGVTVSGKAGDYTYVDLALPSGIKWATYNVGASRPTEYGDYFAWGETSPKDDYAWGTYELCIDGKIIKITKYKTRVSSGDEVDNKTVLDAEDDAATANWGSAWRMPTAEEMDELVAGCTWEWVKDFQVRGVDGLLGTSEKNGATIFLPSAGYRGINGGLDPGCFYWSSSLCEKSDNEARPLQVKSLPGYLKERRLGFSVRAVMK